MLLFISPKYEVYSERVCKNALEKYIFNDFFFHSPSNGKDPIFLNSIILSSLDK